MSDDNIPTMVTTYNKSLNHYGGAAQVDGIIRSRQVVCPNGGLFADEIMLRHTWENRCQRRGETGQYPAWLDQWCLIQTAAWVKKEIAKSNKELHKAERQGFPDMLNTAMSELSIGARSCGENV